MCPNESRNLIFIVYINESKICDFLLCFTNPFYGILKTVHCPQDGGNSFFSNFQDRIKKFESNLDIEIEKRAGEQFVVNNSRLQALEQKRDCYSTQANLVFHRHSEAFNSGKEDSATTHSANQLEFLNKQFFELSKWYESRIDGENGLSDRITILRSAVDKILRRNASTRLSDIEWLQFHNDLQKWIEVCSKVIQILEFSLKKDHKIKTSENDDASSIGLLGFIESLNDWIESSKVALSTNIQSLLVRIDGMNKQLMKWLADYLIETAPSSNLSNKPELKAGCPSKTDVFVTTGLARKPGIGNLLHEASAICISMKSLTEGVRLSIKPILSRHLAEDPSDLALQDDMKRIDTFLEHCDRWRTTVGNLMSNCFGVTIDMLKVDVAEVLSSTNIVEELNDEQNILSENNFLENEDQEENKTENQYCKLVNRTNSINAISFDGNVHNLNLKKIQESQEKVSEFCSEESQENINTLNTVEQLQGQLRESESTIHDTEFRCNELHEKMIILGRELKSKEEEIEVLKMKLEACKGGSDLKIEIGETEKEKSNNARKNLKSPRRISISQGRSNTNLGRKTSKLTLDTGSNNNDGLVRRTSNLGNKTASKMDLSVGSEDNKKSGGGSSRATSAKGSKRNK